MKGLSVDSFPVCHSVSRGVIKIEGQWDEAG